MSGEINRRLPSEVSKAGGSWFLDLLLPGIFSLLLIACLVHLACYALKAQFQPVVGFHYAISAFAL